MSDLQKLIELCEKQSESGTRMAEQNAALTAQNNKLTEQIASMLQRLDEDAQARGGGAPIEHGAGAGARPAAVPLTPEQI